MDNSNVSIEGPVALRTRRTRFCITTRRVRPKPKEQSDVGGNNYTGNDFENENAEDKENFNSVIDEENQQIEVIEVSSTDSYSDDSEAQSSETQLAYNEVSFENHIAQDDNVVPDAESIFEEELPETEEVPDEELPTDTDADSLKEKAEKPSEPNKLPELDKYWKPVNDDPTDFTGWTYLLQYVDQRNDLEAVRKAYDAFLSHYPYCYIYWRKYADYEKRNKDNCEKVFERGLKVIPLSVDLWIHYLTYVRSTRADDEDFVRAQFERALVECGLEFRSDGLWDSYIKWETDGKRPRNVTKIYDKLLATPTQRYRTHFKNFQEHIATNPPNEVLQADEFLALSKEVCYILKHNVTSEPVDNPGVPPSVETYRDACKQTEAIRERIVSIRRKIHNNTVNAVTARWHFEEGIKRPFFHVTPLERYELQNWREYLDYEIAQGNQTRIVVLFERCLIACALYEEFWLRYVHYLEGLKDPDLQPKIKDVYKRACTIHHFNKPSLHLQWAVFEESIQNFNGAAEILVNLEKAVPNVLEITYRLINLERRRGDNVKCAQLYEHNINNSKNKLISSNLAIRYARFCWRICNNLEKAMEVLNGALAKDDTNPKLYLELIDLTLQKKSVEEEKEVLDLIESFLEKETVDVQQKVQFAQRKLESLEDFGCDVQCVQKAYDEYQKYRLKAMWGG